MSKNRRDKSEVHELELCAAYFRACPPEFRNKFTAEQMLMVMRHVQAHPELPRANEWDESTLAAAVGKELAAQLQWEVSKAEAGSVFRRGPWTVSRHGFGAKPWGLYSGTYSDVHGKFATAGAAMRKAAQLDEGSR